MEGVVERYSFLALGRILAASLVGASAVVDVEALLLGQAVADGEGSRLARSRLARTLAEERRSGSSGMKRSKTVQQAEGSALQEGPRAPGSAVECVS